MKKKKLLAVVGAAYGDEGKGITTDYLCLKNPNSLVIRYSGGPQAGHTVCYKDIRHVFASFGSGTLRGVPTYISHHCVIDPIAIMNEYNILKEKGISPTLYIDERCPVITPYDVANLAHNVKFSKNGTCGVGIGPTYQREQDLYSLTFYDIFYPDVLKIKLNLIIDYYTGKIDVGFIKDRYLLSFLKACDALKRSVVNNPLAKKCRGIPEISKCDTYIFEGSQGLLLDQNIGFFPHVTWGNTGSKNIVELCGTEDIEFYLVTRAYQTRHGNGPMTNEDITNDIDENPNETNKLHPHQGIFRKSLLDPMLLHYAMNKDYVIRNAHKKTLVMTCLDHIPLLRGICKDSQGFHSLGTSGDLARYIAKCLQIPNLITSVSEYSENMKEHKIVL